MRRRARIDRRVLLGLLALGFVPGLLSQASASAAFDTRYVAEVVLPVGTFDPKVAQHDYYQVAIESLAADYARLDGITRPAVSAGAELQLSPIPKTRLLRIRASAATEGVAEETATAAASSLIAFVDSMTTEVTGEDAKREYRRLVERLAAAATDAQIIRARHPEGVPVGALAPATGAAAALGEIRGVAHDDARIASERDRDAATLRGRPRPVVTRIRSVRPIAAACLIALVAAVLAIVAALWMPRRPWPVREPATPAA